MLINGKLELIRHFADLLKFSNLKFYAQDIITKISLEFAIMSKKTLIKALCDNIDKYIENGKNGIRPKEEDVISEPEKPPEIEKPPKSNLIQEEKDTKQIYDFIDDISFYRDIHNDIEPLKQEKKYNSILEKLEEVEKSAFEILKIHLDKDGENEKVEIAIIGDFNSGKSSFINSLLREDVCPVDVSPTTSTITKFIYSDRKKIYLIKDDVQEEIDQKKYNNLSQHKWGQEEERKNYKFEYHYPFDGFRDIVLHDTPGFNSQNKEDDNITIRQAKSADIIFLVLDGLRGR